MRLETTRIPPVSREFYERLIVAFPPIDPRNITPETSMLEIQRSAAQQEMIKFIEQAVRPSSGEPEITHKPKTMWERLKSLLFKR